MYLNCQKIPKYLIYGIICKNKKIDVIENLKTLKMDTWWYPGQGTDPF